MRGIRDAHPNPVSSGQSQATGARRSAAVSSGQSGRDSGDLQSSGDAAGSAGSHPPVATQHIMQVIAARDARQAHILQIRQVIRNMIAQGQTGQPLHYEQAVHELIQAGMAETREDAQKVISDMQQQMHAEASQTARWQGLRAYAGSFGVPGILARGAAQGVAYALPGHPAIAGAVGAAAPLVMPALHGAAAAAAAPAPDSAQFVAHPGHQLPPNAVGNAFRAFAPALGFGNTVAQSVVDGPRIAAAAGQGTDNVTPGLEQGLTTLKSILLAIPGSIAAINTVRNLMATQAAGNMSFQQSLKSTDGARVGVVISYPTSIPRDGGKLEVGQVKIDQNGVRYTFKILRDNSDSGAFTFTIEAESIPPATKECDRGGTFVSKLGIRNPAALTKISALASTLAANALISPYLQPAIQRALEAANTPPHILGTASAALSMAVTNLLLGYDFIPKFMSFSQSTDEGRGGAAQKVAWASVPIVGGMLQRSMGRVDTAASPRMSESTFEILATNSALNLAGLNQSVAGQLDANVGPLFQPTTNGSWQVNMRAANAVIEANPVIDAAENAVDAGNP